MKAGEVEEVDSLHFQPAETDGGEDDVEMETQGDKSKKKKDKSGNKEDCCADRPQRGVERDGVRQKPKSD